jgi:hypothetical protein
MNLNSGFRYGDIYKRNYIKSDLRTRTIKNQEFNEGQHPIWSSSLKRNLGKKPEAKKFNYHVVTMKYNGF